MSEPARPRAEMRDFPGIDLEADGLDVAAGAGREQTNLMSWSGEMRVRRGLKLVTFEQETDVS